MSHSISIVHSKSVLLIYSHNLWVYLHLSSLFYSLVIVSMHVHVHFGEFISSLVNLQVLLAVAAVSAF